MKNDKDPTKPTILTPQEARQGETTGRVRWILTISILLAVFVGVILVGYFQS